MATLEHLPKSIRDFIGRDVVYVIAGGVLLSSVLYRFDCLPSRDTPLAFYILGIGLAYVVGFALQDLFSIIGLVTTAQVTKPCRLQIWLYERFEKKPWKQLAVTEFENVGSALNKYLKSEIARAHYERTITHMIVGASVGPCMLISSSMILWRWCVHHHQIDLTVSIMSFILSIGLILLSWVKAMQITIVDANAIASATPDAKKN